MMYFQIDEKYSWKVIVLTIHGREPEKVASMPLLMSKGRKGEEKSCLRSYDVNLSPSTYNEISIIYGIQA